ncbi:amino acid ABC transporter permease [Cellulomonas xiejunii]|uniref:Amino acid ABC transporter permease n=1 Tax=Cellulomonas xiejunii TaxID=2968083 RepID=A0ABY5KTF7_9CELL|nr:amino acid ABC transporter permease [Cellulomonas xiejunii]MCC2321688.1 amino acid ABC transporter permease [Cellulomonas xiejunii]UUI72999.1 amino acid ABC transporter permease [Cellulomonas xiejunii]
MTGDTWDLVVSSIGPLLSGAIRGTIPLTLISFAIGLVLALVVALARLSRNRLVSGAARVYISLIRGTPLLVQLFIIFYALPSLGLVIDPFPSAVVAFSLNVGGYAAETIRAAILSVPRGQWEAAATIGLDHRLTLQRVVLPQALRVAVPPLSNTFISLVKDTSLASTIMVTELLRKAQEIAAPTYEFMTLYSLAAVIYWLICLVLSTGQSRLERRLDRFVAH